MPYLNFPSSFLRVLYLCWEKLIWPVRIRTWEADAQLLRMQNLPLNPNRFLRFLVLHGSDLGRSIESTVSFLACSKCRERERITTKVLCVSLKNVSVQILFNFGSMVCVISHCIWSGSSIPSLSSHMYILHLYLEISILWIFPYWYSSLSLSSCAEVQ